MAGSRRERLLPLVVAIFSAAIGGSFARRCDPTLRPWPVTSTHFSVPPNRGAFSFDRAATNFNFTVADVRRGDSAGVQYVIPGIQISKDYELRLDIADRYPHEWPGQEELQVIVNESLLWRQDVGEGRFTGWIPIRKRLTPTSGSLTLRVQLVVIGDPPAEAAWGHAGPFGVRYVKLVGPEKGTAINVSAGFLVRKSRRYAWIAVVAAASAALSLLLFRTAIRNRRRLASLSSIFALSKRKAFRLLLPVFLFLWPFLYFLPRVVSFRGQFLATGMDFLTMSYPYKLYLLDCLSHFRLPLWSPAEGAGYPFYSSPFTQSFYAFNLPLAFFYRIAGGYQVLDHQRFTVLGISIFAVGLFFWLRSLRLRTRAALAATLIMSVSFRMAEILRFPNAAHTAAWYPWILLIVTKAIQAKSGRQLAKWSLLLVPILVLFITAGYPYYVYYSQFLLVPYLLLLTIPVLRRTFRLADPPMPLRALLFLAFSAMAASVICYPYAQKVLSLLNETTDRGAGNPLEYATSYVFNLEDSIGSLLFPPAAQWEGWYFFGVTGLLLILLYLVSPAKSGDGVRPPALTNPRLWYLKPGVKVVFLVWFALISSITYGRSSPVFLFLWNHLPFFPRLRVWGRLNIVLVPVIAWLLAIAYQHFEDTVRQRGTRRLVWTLGGLYAFVLTGQLLLFTTKRYDPYWNSFINRQVAHELAFIVLGALAAALLCATLWLASRRGFRTQRIRAVILALLVGMSAVETSHVGLRMWSSRATTVPRRPLEVARLNQESFGVPRTFTHTTLPYTAAFSAGIIENWYFARYVQFLARTEGESAARARLLGLLDGRRLYFSESVNHATVTSYLGDCGRFEPPITVLSYSGDRLAVEIDAPTAGYLSFIDNWQQDWEGTVDRKDVPLETLFGTFKSVKLSAGKHVVTFEYRPRLWRATKTAAPLRSGNPNPAGEGAERELRTETPYTAPMDSGRLQEDLKKFFSTRSEGIVAAYLFGSFARGDSRARSDVDVAVLFRESQPPTLDSPLFRLEGDLERLLGRPVQVISLNEAPVDLIHRVFRDGKLLFEEDRSARIRFEVKKRNEYFDLLPILRRYRKSERAAS